MRQTQSVQGHSNERLLKFFSEGKDQNQKNDHALHEFQVAITDSCHRVVHDTTVTRKIIGRWT